MFEALEHHPGLWFVAATLLPILAVALMLLAGFFRNALRSAKNSPGLGAELFQLLGGEVTGKGPAYVATAAIGLAFVCSLVGSIIFFVDPPHPGGHAASPKHEEASHKGHGHDQKPKAKENKPHGEKAKENEAPTEKNEEHGNP